MAVKYLFVPERERNPRLGVNTRYRHPLLCTALDIPPRIAQVPTFRHRRAPITPIDVAASPLIGQDNGAVLRRGRYGLGIVHGIFLQGGYGSSIAVTSRCQILFIPLLTAPLTVTQPLLTSL